jgi:hypothetical protein
MEVLDYVVIARGRTIVAACGDKTLITDQEMKKLFPSRSPTTHQILRTDKLFSFLTTPGYVFAAVSGKLADRSRPLFLLEILSHRWVTQFGHFSICATAHSLDSLFEQHYLSLFRSLIPEVDEQIEFAPLTNRRGEREPFLVRKYQSQHRVSGSRWRWSRIAAASIIIVVIVVCAEAARRCGWRLEKCRR